MKIKIIFWIFITLFSGVATAKEGIPKQFQGMWGSAESCKATKEIGAPPDGGAEITSIRVGRYEFPCELKQVKATGKTKFTGQFSCSSPDGDSSETISLAFVSKGKLNINAAAAVPKCK
jgi:hypothetical protein